MTPERIAELLALCDRDTVIPRPWDASDLDPAIDPLYAEYAIAALNNFPEALAAITQRDEELAQAIAERDKARAEIERLPLTSCRLGGYR